MSKMYDGGSKDCLIEVFNSIAVYPGFFKVKLRVIHKRLKFPFSGEEMPKYYVIPAETLLKWKRV
jgi:hypothetical protein